MRVSLTNSHMRSWSTASEAFSDAYHTALQAARHTLATFYTAPETLPDGKTIPSIAWNGNAYDSGAAFQAAFDAEMPAYTYFEVQSLDAQVLNPNPPPNAGDAEGDAMIDGDAPGEGRKGGGRRGGPQGGQKEEDLVGSLLVMVNGFVRLEEKKEGPTRGFSETLVLVPNKDFTRKDGSRRWVVQSQNFRYVV